MNIKQVKLAKPLPGTSTDSITSHEFHLEWNMEKQHLKAVKKLSEKSHLTYYIFPSNIAWILDEGVKASDIVKKDDKKAK